jgi:hypothetical protein
MALFAETVRPTDGLYIRPTTFIPVHEPSGHRTITQLTTKTVCRLGQRRLGGPGIMAE